MQIIFDKLGRCTIGSTRCAFLDGNYLKQPCRGCERNPRLIELQDQFKSSKALQIEIDAATKKALDVSEEDHPDVQAAAQNDSALAEFGVKSAAERNSSRGAGSQRPNVA